MSYYRRLLIAVAAATSAIICGAQEGLDYNAELWSNYSTGKFAPYMIGSWSHGKHAQKNAELIDVSASKSIDMSHRFSWGFGVEALGGYSSKNTYQRWDASASDWTEHSCGPAAVWLQQLYSEVKYRGVFLTVGIKEHSSALMNPLLSSGDFVESGNARPIPEVRAGFIDFQDIPFTNGWVQIQGEISYGKFTDNGYLKKHYNYYDYHLSTGALYSYKRCFFRTNPAKPLSITFGMQVATIFGGTCQSYQDGKLVKTEKYDSSIKAMFNVFLPRLSSKESFVEGSFLGSWDFNARYRLPGGDELKAYFQWPWEDGSGVAKRNKIDGIWGIEYHSSETRWISGAVIEYIDFRDQSGPLHNAPADHPGTDLNVGVSGRDNYYNNGFHNSYANYGMSIGTPFLLSPLYNLDGYPAFTANRANGFHCGIMGNLSPRVSYRLLGSYQRAWGTYMVPFTKLRTSTSMMFEASCDAASICPGLKLRAQLAFDSVKLRGNNFGASLSISYSGTIANLFTK